MSKRKISIGAGVTVNLDRLIGTRLLVQANSGGGKSWALRRLLEQTHGAVQQIVIDPEGEFATLREKFDYILAARQGGDTLADPRTAKLLAERLLELGVSAILDIYELQPRERVAFVKAFLEALVDAPKQLWHPVLVVLDEAHVYAPEQGHGEAESDDAVKGLATRGRKRGFCLVAATQRLSKLHKDVAAECNNKLIGRTALDVDMKRAGAELGFAKGDLLQLRDLEDGEFFAFGPALSKTVTKVKVGAVETTHPKAGSKLAAVVPPPTDKVKAVLSKLADLPAEAEAREKTVKDLKTEIANLKRELTTAKKAVPPAPKTDPEKAEKIAELKQSLARHQRALEAAMKILVKVQAVDFAVDTEEGRKALEQAVAAAVKQVTAPIEKRVTAAAARVEGIKTAAKEAEATIAKLLDEKIELTVQVQRREPFAIAGRRGDGTPRASHPPQARSRRGTGEPSASGDVTPAQQKILNALAFFQGIGIAAVEKTQLALMAGVPPTSGGYKNNLGALRSQGYLEYPTPGDVALTEAGVAIANADGVPSTTDELHAAIRAKLPPAKWTILAALIERYPNEVTKEELAELCSVPSSSGGYKNNLGSLRSLGLIAYPRPGTVAATPVLFLEA